MNSNQPGDQEISQEAYRLWEQDGRPEGRDQEYWFRAKESLGKKQQQPAGRTGSARSAGSIASTEETQPAASATKRSSGAKKPSVRQNA